MNDSTPDIPLKQCTKCGEWKPATPEHFGKFTSAPDRLAYRCLECARAYDRWRHTHGKAEFEAQQAEKKRMREQGLQKCSICGEVKPLSQFQKGGNKKSGKRSACRVCTSAQMGHEHTDRKQFPEAPEGWKYCRRCEALKPLGLFGKIDTKHNRDGKTSYCLECENEEQKQKAYANGVKPREKLPPGFKRCTACRQIKENTRDHFGYNASRHDFLDSYCIECRRAYNSQPEQKARRSKYAKERNQRPDIKIRNAYQTRFHYWTNDKMRQYALTYQYHYWRNNPEYRKRDKLRKRELYKTNPVYRLKAIRASMIGTQNRRARKLGLPDSLTLQDWHRALDYFNGCCAVCGRQLNDLFGEHTAGRDHWVPISSSDCPGTVATNIIPLCHGVDGCNNSKGPKDPQKWLVERYGKRKAKQILERIHAYFEWVKSNNEPA